MKFIFRPVSGLAYIKNVCSILSMARHHLCTAVAITWTWSSFQADRE